ncbi:NAD(P)-binding domain-containing protein [Streptomyces sp. NPDC005263]
MTHISIIGTGNMGQALADLAGKGGNVVRSRPAMSSSTSRTC